MLHNCYNLLCDRPIHTKDCRIIAIKIKIRRTKLCVLISIAVPSYLMLSANILTSVVNNSLCTFPADCLPEIYAPGICPGYFSFICLNINSYTAKIYFFLNILICLKAALPATWHFYLFLIPVNIHQYSH